jgi:hypothetical protein
MLADETYDAVVLAESVDDGMAGFLTWLGRRHKGIVVTVPEPQEGGDPLAEASGAGAVAKLVVALGVGGTT